MSSAPIPPSSSSAPSSHQNTTSTPPKQKSTLAVLSLITLLLAIAVAGFWGYTGSTSIGSGGSTDANLFGLRRLLGAGGRASASRGFVASTTSTTTTPGGGSLSDRVTKKNKKLGEGGFEDRVTMARTPVYFLSHGGVSFPYPILFFSFPPFLCFVV